MSVLSITFLHVSQFEQGLRLKPRAQHEVGISQVVDGGLGRPGAKHEQWGAPASASAPPAADTVVIHTN
jgi:hypothetical protein